ncbi:MAG: glycosyltransferase [Bacteroidota bacterium]|nr:glycosyltransferase [Bacteroidota bacterium]
MNYPKKEYFNRLATRRIKQRAARSYYWNDITKYCNYFSHDGLSVLEIGCGTGELLNTIKAKRKTGIDFSEEMIYQGKNQFPDLDLRVMAAEDLQMNEKYDLIILSNLIGYLDDIQIVFSRLHKVCHPNTKIIVTYYNFLWEPVLKFSEMIGLKTRTPVQNWLSLPEIRDLLKLSGFESYRNSRRMILPVYIPLLAELLNNFIAKFPFFRLLCLNNFVFARPVLESNEEKFKEAFSVSVVIPACNESGNIENAVLRMPKLGSKTEIIFVESNSTDDTWEQIKKVQEKYASTHSIRILKTEGKGKNDAVRKGFEMADGDILMILDADLTVAPRELSKFYNAIATGKGDFINGSRLVYPMEKEAMRFLNLLGNKFFSSVFTWLLDQRLKDTLCGTKVLFKKDYELLAANRSYFGDFDPFGDFDLLFGAHKLNLNIVEVPVRYRERTYGRTNISRFRHGWILLRMCFFAARKIKFR